MRQTINMLSERAHLAAERHLLFVQRLHGLRNAAMHGPDGFELISIPRLQEDLLIVEKHHLDHELHLLQAYAPATSREARTEAVHHLRLMPRADAAEAASAAHSGREAMTVEFLFGEIAAQSRRDVAQVLRDYRKGALRVDMLKRAGVGWLDARIQVATSAAERPQKTWFLDRAGRRHPSQRFIRQSWRAGFRDHFMGVYLDTLMEHGEREAEIWHPDPQHRAYGMRVNLLDFEADYDRLDLDRVFHPNSDALPRAVRQDEDAA